MDLSAYAFRAWRAAIINIQRGCNSKTKQLLSDSALILMIYQLINKEGSAPFEALLYHPFARNKRQNKVGIRSISAARLYPASKPREKISRGALLSGNRFTLTILFT